LMLDPSPFDVEENANCAFELVVRGRPISSVVKEYGPSL